MPTFRTLARVAALLILFALCIGPHLAARALTGRSDWPRRFLRAAASIVGARVRVVGAPVTPGTLLVANHVSWMDILTLAGATGCAFVSKDDLGHGIVHWLADQNRTIYVRREDRRGAGRQAERIAAALSGPYPVALFPEGTTGPGDRLLPFRPALFEAAALAGLDVAVRPAAIDYGPAATDIAWFEEAGGHNVRRLLGRKGTLPVTLHLLPPLKRQGADRKRLAAAAETAIAGALALASSPAPTRL